NNKRLEKTLMEGRRSARSGVRLVAERPGAGPRFHPNRARARHRRGATMIEEPVIHEVEEQPTAVIRFTIPREEMKNVMGPAIGELMSTVAAQGVKPVGPVFTHHFRIEPGIFDFEVGVPVAAPIHPAGRVVASKLPAATVARMVHQGPYDGLESAWIEF